MTTTYMNDRKLGDFIIGNATGARYNFYSGFGASCRQTACNKVAMTSIRSGYYTDPTPAPYFSSGGNRLEGFVIGGTLPMRPREPGAFEKLFDRLSLGPSMWFHKRSGQLVKTKAWSVAVLVFALLAVACVATLGWGSGNPWTQMVAIALGFAGGALVPYATLLLCSGVLVAYAFLMLGLLVLGMIVVGLLIATAALASAGGAIYCLLMLVGAI